MLRRFWRTSVVCLARSRAATRFMQETRFLDRFTQKFIAGKSPEDALARAERLRAAHAIRASLYYLAEYVEDAEGVAGALTDNLRIAALLADAELETHVSTGPIQLGYRISPERAAENARTLAERIASAIRSRHGLHCLLFGMEDPPLNDPTIALHDALKEKNLPVALTLQANLRRTEADLRAQIERGSTVRLVKGAFAAAPDIAFTGRREIKANFRNLIALMLSEEAKRRGFYPAIATHDTDLQDFACAEAAKNGWKPGEYEFEMLLGVRTDVAVSLARRGERIRQYLPFGRDWWPYAANRIAESPENALLLARSVFS